jgi:hypothetical protein
MSGGISVSEAPTTGLGKLLMENRFFVPTHQRDYRWDEDRVKKLFDDLTEASAVDLLKNYLFGLAHEESRAGQLLGQVETRWAQITQTLQNAKEEDFLRVFWTSRHGRTQLDQIFEDVRSKYKSGAAANDLSIDLLEAAEHYAALDVSDDPVWGRYSQDARERISTLRMLGSKQIRPVLLSAIQCFESTEFERLLRLLEVVIVRWQLIGGERTGALEIQCARLAHLIFQRKIGTALKAREVLDGVYLSDSAFHSKFTEKDNLSNQKAIYLLKRIEEHERQVRLGDSAKELGPARGLTIEHVLPRNPSDEWLDETRADPALVADCALRLGNICLLSEPRNRDAGRNSFDEKKALYAASELLTTREIAVPKKWDRKAIHHRQAWLAKRATTVWRFP